MTLMIGNNSVERATPDALSLAYKREVNAVRTKRRARKMCVFVMGAWVIGPAFLWAVFALVVVVVACRVLVSVAEEKRNIDKYVTPLAAIMIEHLPTTGVSKVDDVRINVHDEITRNPTKYVRLPKRYPIADNDSTSCVTIKWPLSLGASDVKRKAAEDAIAAEATSLGSSPVAEWVRDGYALTLRMYRGETFTDAAGYIAADLLPYLDDERLLLGFDVKGAPVYHDETVNGPHIKVSASTGAGKTNMFASFVPQWIRQGAQVLILDVKGDEKLQYLVRAIGHPNVKYVRELDNIGNALCAVLAEIMRRVNANDEAIRNGGFAPQWPKLRVLLDEGNATAVMLAELQRALVTSGKLPNNSAQQNGMDAFAMSAFLGRSVGIRLYFVGQRVEARALGRLGSMTREQLESTLLGGKPSVRTWRMFVPKSIPYRTPTHKHGWFFVHGDTLTEFLPVFMGSPDPADKAGHVPTYDHDVKVLSDADSVPAREWASMFTTLDTRVTDRPAVSGMPSHVAITMAERVSYADIVELGRLHGYALTVPMLRKAKSRDAFIDFADSDNKLFSRIDALAWLAARGEPSGEYWEANHAHAITRDMLTVKMHYVYGLRVEGVAGYPYVGHTGTSIPDRLSFHKADAHDGNPHHAWKADILDADELWSGLCTKMEAMMLVEAPLIDAYQAVYNYSIPSIDGPRKTIDTHWYNERKALTR